MKTLFKTGQEKLKEGSTDPEVFFNIKLKTLKGDTLTLQELRARAKCYLVVNVASK